MITFILGFLTTFILIGYVILFLLGIWVLIDAFLIPGMIRKKSEQLREKLARDVLAYNQTQSGQYREEAFDSDF